MTARPALDEVLADAAVTTPVYDREMIAASRQAIEADLADAVWQEALRRDAYAQDMLTRAREVTVPGTGHQPYHSPPVALREQTTRDLNELCRTVVTTSHAAADIAGLVNSRKIEPDGALIFACLLHLADRTDGALFWWQFSAGAGKATAALCLHLLHLQRGELRDADHWAREAADLEHHNRTSSGTGDEHRAVPLERPQRVSCVVGCEALYDQVRTTAESVPLRVVAGLWESDRHTVRPCTAACLALSAALHHLDVGHDPCFGDIPRPDPTLATRLETCIPF